MRPVRTLAAPARAGLRAELARPGRPQSRITCPGDPGYGDPAPPLDVAPGA